MTSIANYRCPLCQSSLTKQNNMYKCHNNHSFDIAKEGYVNLLPVQQKKSLQPGDDKNMVMARRLFLQEGFYEFLRTALVSKIASLNPSKVIDLGCGEGYYTDEIERSTGCETYGIDISKAAVKYAAKRNKNVHYSVATNAHLPFENQSIDVIANVFAPLVGIECQRVLSEDGSIISVAPGPDHLLELKQQIYKEPQLHDAPKAPEGFELIEADNVKQTISLERESDIENLLTMTPFGWKISVEAKAKLLANLPFKVQLDFIISQFKATK